VEQELLFARFHLRVETMLKLWGAVHAEPGLDGARRRGHAAPSPHHRGLRIKTRLSPSGLTALSAPQHRLGNGRDCVASYFRFFGAFLAVVFFFAVFFAVFFFAAGMSYLLVKVKEPVQRSTPYHNALTESKFGRVDNRAQRFRFRSPNTMRSRFGRKAL
jgi:hypothetical protein